MEERTRLWEEGRLVEGHTGMKRVVHQEAEGTEMQERRLEVRRPARRWMEDWVES